MGVCAEGRAGAPRAGMRPGAQGGPMTNNAKAPPLEQVRLDKWIWALVQREEQGPRGRGCDPARKQWAA